MARYSEFGKKLNIYLRNVEHENSSWLAGKVGMDISTITRWRNGETRPGTCEKVIEVAKVLRISVSDCEELVEAAHYKLDDRIKEIIKINLVSSDTSGESKAPNRGAVRQKTFPSTSKADVIPTTSSLQLPLDLPPVGALPVGSYIPYHHNRYFVGREVMFRALAELFSDADGSRGNAVGTTAIVTGLGGMGKTQLAAQFAHHYGSYFEGGVFWVHMENPANVPASIAQAGAHLPGSPPDFSVLDLPKQVELICAEWRKPVPRLLIFDNCEDPELLMGWGPTTGGSHVLVTSRRASWNLPIETEIFALKKFQRPQSIRLLCRFRPDLDADNPALDAIADCMGDLPLALHLAGYYLNYKKRFVTPTTYLTALHGEAQLLVHPSLQEQKGNMSPTDHEQNIDMTFRVSYQQLDATDAVDETALYLLARAACLAPSIPIPEDLLLASSSQFKSGDDQKDEALHRILDLGLLESEDDGLVLHPLFSQFIRKANRDAAHQDKAQTDIEVIIEQQTRKLNDTGFPTRLLSLQPHLYHVTEQAQVRRDFQAATLCSLLGHHLLMCGDFVGSKFYFEQNLAIRHKGFGEKHPFTATSLSNLAVALHNMGDLKGARTHHEQGLAIRKEVQGNKHIDTALSLNNLGIVLKDMGDFEGAKAHNEEALSIWQEALGKRHPQTALGLNNLGTVLKAMGDLQGAKAHYEEALSIWQEALGKRHPQTAFGLNNLGIVLQDMDDLKDAKAHHEEALDIWQEALGKRHPETALSLSNLGSVLQDMDDLKDAKAYHEEALDIRREALGEWHPKIALSLSNLGTVLKAMGDLEGAKSHYEEALDIRREALGKRHPDTAFSLNNLGNALHGMGDLEGAKAYHEEALAIRQQTLGEEHPDTIESFRMLGIVLRDMGDLDAAQSYLEKALTLRKEVSGDNHEDTAWCMLSFGLLMQKKSDLNAAQSYFEQALAIFKEKLGPDHARTESAKKDLDALMQQRNEEDDAQGGKAA